MTDPDTPHAGDRPTTTDRPDPAEMSLDELRREIEEIDQELVELIARRTYVGQSVAEVKAQEGIPTTDQDREAQVLDRAAETAERFDLDPDLVASVFELLIELNKAEQRDRR